MAINGTAPDTHISGVVRSVNDKGLKLEGYDTWFNVSRFAVGVTLPERGAAVTVTLDKAGFLRAVAPADGAEAPMVNSAPQSAQSAPSAQSVTSATRDRTITRLAVLKAAAEYAASKPQSSSGDVLKIAASWERWVLRDDEPTADLVDAF